MNSTICSTATLIGIHVMVGGWKSHVFAIQNTKAAILSPNAPLIACGSTLYRLNRLKT